MNIVNKSILAAILTFITSLQALSLETAEAVIPSNDLLDVSAPEPVNQESEKTFVFDPSLLRWYAYDANGALIKEGRASGGDTNRGFKTPDGTYEIYQKRGPGCKSSIYPRPRGGAPMPYCMFFHQGFAIHGAKDVPDHNASHGCVRVDPEEAKWLSQNFIDIGTKVVIKSY